jgi:putative transposase
MDMNPSRFTKEQVIWILRGQEAGAKMTDVWQTRHQRRHVLQMEGQWPRSLDAKRLKALEDEIAKLKKLLAEAMLDNAMLKDVAAKKW